MTDDVTVRARAALEGVTDDPMLIHLADAHEVVGLVSDLLAEVENQRTRTLDAVAELAMSRDGIQVHPMTEAESNLMTQVLDLRRERTALNAEVERLREREAEHAGIRTILRDEIERLQTLQRDDQQNAIGAIAERDAALAEVERLRGALDRVEQLAECYETATATHTVVSDVTTSYRSCAEDLRNILRGDQ